MAGDTSDDLDKVFEFAAGIIEEKIVIQGFDKLLSFWLDPTGEMLTQYEASAMCWNINYYIISPHYGSML